MAQFGNHILPLNAMPHLIERHEVILPSEVFCNPWRRNAFSDILKDYDFNGNDKPIKYSSTDHSLNEADHSPERRAYNIMIIEWHENVAYRLAVGWIYTEALARSFPPGVQWKETALG